MRTIYTIIALGLALTASARDIHVATDGDDTADGSPATPLLTIHKAVELVEPGETIWVHGGTYNIDRRIKIPKKATTAEKPICLFAFQGERVVIDGSTMNPQSEAEFKMARCIYLNHEANYWHFRGLELCNAKDNGMKVEGSYNIIENCVFHDNNDTGLQIGMYKDFSIEETKELPAGEPQFNPGWQFCRGNKVINCDAYYNYDALTFTGTDDGGDADGFACKLFPGPGTEFHGCRAWNNSDDNWDLYMVYHPVVIDNCWAWNGGYDKHGNACGNGNGFKLGGGGSAGGSAFDQSTGAHVVTRCVSFNNLHKGFDQNNAYEGMYILGCTAWGNEYNYRFPTVFQYGGMVIRNCVGFRPTKLNHEFLSEDKPGSVLPDTEWNSWTTLDGCSPYKEGTKINGQKPMTRDYTSEFLSLSEDLAKAPRLADGSLPENDFARLKEASLLKDVGTPITNFVPTRFMTEAQAAAAGMELTTAASVTIPYNDAAPDFGAYESGTPLYATLKLVEGRTEQTVFRGEAIAPITYKWGAAATDVEVLGLTDGLTATKDPEAKRITIAGTLGQDADITLTTIGGTPAQTAVITLRTSDLRAGELLCLTSNSSQTIDEGDPIATIVFRRGGGATAFTVESLPEGLTATEEADSLTIAGTPTEGGTYTITATGGREPITLRGTITLAIPTRVLTGDWYHIQDPIDQLPADLQGVVSLLDGSDGPSSWDPERTESGTVPAGCTAGAIDMAKQGGGIEWKLPSLAELKVNLHFTGGRTFEVRWQAEDETEEHVWTTGSLKKTTLTDYDLMAKAGIETTERPITVRLINAAGSGGARVYDFLVRVYRHTTTDGITHTRENRPTSQAYDLLGRKVTPDFKGLRIVGGRKIISK